METNLYRLEFNDDELRCLLSGLYSFIKNMNFFGDINEYNVNNYKRAFEKFSTLYIKLASYIQLTNENSK